MLVAPDDGLKLLVILLAGGGLLALGRWSSRLGPNASGESRAEVPTPDASALLLDAETAPRVWPPSAEEVAASLPYDPALGNLRIVKLFFDKADVSPAPADPEVFADDLHIQVYDPDTGNYWWQSYFVATPKGLSKILRDKSWKYLYAAAMLVVPRYDLEEIRRAVVSRIVADHDHFSGKEKELLEEESL